MPQKIVDAPSRSPVACQAKKAPHPEGISERPAMKTLSALLSLLVAVLAAFAAYAAPAAEAPTVLLGADELVSSIAGAMA